MRIYLAGAAMMSVSAFTACNNTNSNNASYAADSANKAQIAKTDSANHEMIAKADSGNKEAMSKADSANKAKTELKEDASKFLVKAFESGLFEIELSQLAAKRATNADVKALAAQLVTAHKAINDKMVKIAFNANFKLPGGIDSDHAKDEAGLDKLKGADFDKKYMDMIVSGHEKSVDNYKSAYKDLSEGATKAFAGATLPMIQDHLAMAKKVKEKIK